MSVCRSASPQEVRSPSASGSDFFYGLPRRARRVKSGRGVSPLVFVLCFLRFLLRLLLAFCAAVGVYSHSHVERIVLHPMVGLLLFYFTASIPFRLGFVCPSGGCCGRAVFLSVLVVGAAESSSYFQRNFDVSGSHARGQPATLLSRLFSFPVPLLSVVFVAWKRRLPRVSLNEVIFVLLQRARSKQDGERQQKEMNTVGLHKARGAAAVFRLLEAAHVHLSLCFFSCFGGRFAFLAAWVLWVAKHKTSSEHGGSCTYTWTAARWFFCFWIVMSVLRTDDR